MPSIIDRYIEHPPKHPVKIRMTRPLAEELMERNVSLNRKLNYKKMNRYSDLMRTGGWHEELPHPVCVDVNGEMMDGQHRVGAIVSAGVPIETYVAFGLPTELYHVIDRGSVKNLSHSLKFGGYKYPAQLGSAGRWVYQYERFGGPMRSEKIEDMLLYDFIEKFHGDLPNFITDHIQPLFAPYFGAQSPIAAVWYLCQRLHPLKAKEFWQAFITGNEIGSDDPTHPIIHLRKRFMIAQVEAAQGKKLDSMTRTAYVVKAWNAWLVGKSLRFLTWYRRGDNKESFPEIR